MKTAILIPCYNEERTIATVIRDCQKFLPKASIYVYDNNSSDRTVETAIKAGKQSGNVTVSAECRQGKGNVVRRMFADIDADIYVMIDGDATYDVRTIPSLISLLQKENLDMVVGARKETETACYRPGHRLGNKLLTKIVETFFRCQLQDMLSGLRVFSKRFVKSFPAESKGFEIETELTIWTMSRRLPFKEVQVDYFSRPEGSVSKLSTVKDGIIIIKTIILLIKEECPLLFFGLIAIFLFLAGLIIGLPIIAEFLQTGMVPRLPTAVLASSLMVCAFISFLIGLVLDSVANMKKEISRSHYLRVK